MAAADALRTAHAATSRAAELERTLARREREVQRLTRVTEGLSKGYGGVERELRAEVVDMKRERDGALQERKALLEQVIRLSQSTLLVTLEPMKFVFRVNLQHASLCAFLLYCNPKSSECVTEVPMLGVDRIVMPIHTGLCASTRCNQSQVVCDWWKSLVVSRSGNAVCEFKTTASRARQALGQDGLLDITSR
jgi:hypothetical protein